MVMSEAGLIVVGGGKYLTFANASWCGITGEFMHGYQVGVGGYGSNQFNLSLCTCL